MQIYALVGVLLKAHTMWWCTEIDKYGVHNMLGALLMFSLTRYFGVAVLEGRLLVAGGFAGKEGGFLTSVEEMEIVEDAGSWVESSFNLNTPRSVVDFPLLHSIMSFHLQEQFRGNCG